MGDRLFLVAVCFAFFRDMQTAHDLKRTVPSYRMKNNRATSRENLSLGGGEVATQSAEAGKSHYRRHKVKRHMRRAKRSAFSQQVTTRLS